MFGPLVKGSPKGFANPQPSREILATPPIGPQVQSSTSLWNSTIQFIKRLQIRRAEEGSTRLDPRWITNAEAVKEVHFSIWGKRELAMSRAN